MAVIICYFIVHETAQDSLFTNRVQSPGLQGTFNHWATIVAGVRQRVNLWRPRQNGRHFPDDIFKWVFLIENVWIAIKISPKLVPKGLINTNPVLVYIMAWRRPGDKPLSEPMMASLLTHICVTGPQWVKEIICNAWHCCSCTNQRSLVISHFNAHILKKKRVYLLACCYGHSPCHLLYHLKQ